MTTWHPSPGETSLARTPGRFATGSDRAVSGMRWFRDTERNDIQKDLAGWPEGPAFYVLSKSERRARAAGAFVLRLAAFVVLAAVEALASAGSAGSSPRGNGRSRDRENEIEDFPVMWAAPGTLARTLPWQLDPSRCPENYRTHVVVTDRRLLVIGFPDDDTTQDEVLWQTDRGDIANVERRTFSKVGLEAVITFTDGSWCRLAPPEISDRWEVPRHLSYDSELVPHEELTPGQTERVAAAMVECSATHAVVTRRPSGNFTIELHDLPALDPREGSDPGVRVMGPNGEVVKFRSGDL